MNSKKVYYNTGEDTCRINVIHEKPIEHAKENMLNPEIYMELSELFKIFADSTRLKILTSLITGELCVCDISEVLDMSQSAVSHQLRILRSKNLVKFRKEGKQAYYSLADNHVIRLMEVGKEHVLE